MYTPSSSREARAHAAWQAGKRLGQRGRWREAADSFRKAHRLQPRDPLYPMALGKALLSLEDPEGALEAVRAAVQLRPDNPDLIQVQASCLKEMKRYEELLMLLKQVPDSVMTPTLRRMLGDVQQHLGRGFEAVCTWLQALSHDMTNVELYLKLGYAFHDLRMRREALECMRTAEALGGTERLAVLRDILVFFEREVGWWTGHQTSDEILKASAARLPQDAVQLANPFIFAVLCEDPQVNLKIARTHSRHLEQTTVRLPPRPVQAHDRIRVGYVSSDFHSHATSILMAELLEHHDRDRFEVFLYSHGRDDESNMRHRVRRAAEHFVELRDATVPEMVHQIRRDAVDILVDLKGYTQESRPQVFAARPAPVQVAYLGFPGSCGASFIDYIVGDPVVTPLSHADRYSEKIAQLPVCYQCNDSRRPIPKPTARSEHGLPENGLVLCGFNQPYKISPDVFDVWCRLLHAVPHSVLWLLECDAESPVRLRQEAAARGVDTNRVIFAPMLPHERHLARMACADLFLDTWPCNGHTTASDALWSGLPVVTVSRETFASRVAGSLLRAIGLSEQVCTTVADYERLALELCLDDVRRQSLRQRVEASRRNSALFDGKLRARELEALFERMWARALAGLPPDHLPASVNRPGS